MKIRPKLYDVVFREQKEDQTTKCEMLDPHFHQAFRCTRTWIPACGGCAQAEASQRVEEIPHPDCQECDFVTGGHATPERCDGKLGYWGFGMWQCESCGHMTYDDELPLEPDYEEKEKAMKNSIK